MTSSSGFSSLSTILEMLSCPEKTITFISSLYFICYAQEGSINSYNVRLSEKPKLKSEIQTVPQFPPICPFQSQIPSPKRNDCPHFYKPEMHLDSFCYCISTLKNLLFLTSNQELTMSHLFSFSQICEIQPSWSVC